MKAQILASALLIALFGSDTAYASPIKNKLAQSTL